MFTYTFLYVLVLSIGDMFNIDFPECCGLQHILKYMVLEGSPADSSEVLLALVQLHWTAQVQKMDDSGTPGQLWDVELTWEDL